MEPKGNQLVKELRPILAKHFAASDENSEKYDKATKGYCLDEIEILSRNVDATIDALEYLTDMEFYLLTEVWHKVVNKTHSQKLADELVRMVNSECNNLAEYEDRLRYSVNHDDA